MAKFALRDKAIELRKLGTSYSQIKKELAVSKSTLSVWLHAYPLSRKQIDQLRGHSERRIERCRQTKQEKRLLHLQEIYSNTSIQIGTLSVREVYLAGLFLYWAEGTKASRGLVQLTNTDPCMLIFFIAWLERLGIPRSRLRPKLHLYADMNIEEKTQFWSSILNLPVAQFSKPYIKKSQKDKRKNYKGRFGEGTCSITVHNVELYEKVITGITHIGRSGIPTLAKV